MKISLFKYFLYLLSFVKDLSIFLMAHFSPVSNFVANMTFEKAPLPISFSNLNPFNSS